MFYPLLSLVQLSYHIKYLLDILIQVFALILSKIKCLSNKNKIFCPIILKDFAVISALFLFLNFSILITHD